MVSSEIAVREPSEPHARRRSGVISRMKTQIWLLIVTAAVLVGACQLAERQWAITVYNNDSVVPVRIRITTASATSEWILRPQQIEVLLRGPGRLGGTVSVVDSDTCQAIATASFDSAPGMLVIVDRGVTGAGPWEITAEPEDPNLEAPVMAVLPACTT